MKSKLNILIIDNTQSKVDNISDALKSIASDHDNDIEIVYKGAIKSAVHHMYYETKTKYDFIFLDILLPVSENDRFSNVIEGCGRILREMQRRKDNTPVILCISNDFGRIDYGNIISIIHYDDSVYLRPLMEQIIL